MGSDDKVVIEVALNENQLQSSNPNVAYTPQALAADARRCLDVERPSFTTTPAIL